MNNAAEKYLEHREEISGESLDLDLKENEVLILESSHGKLGTFYRDGQSSRIGQVLSKGLIKDKDWSFNVLSYVSYFGGKRIKGMGTPYLSIINSENIIARYEE